MYESVKPSVAKCVYVDGFMDASIRAKVDELLGEGNWYQVYWGWEGGWECTGAIQKLHGNQVTSEEAYHMYNHDDLLERVIDPMGEELMPQGIYEQAINPPLLLTDASCNQYELIYHFYGFDSEDGGDRYQE